jgi:hypothetical protein
MVQSFAKYVGEMVHYPASQVVGIIGDTFKMFRLTNQVRMLANAKKLMEEKGVIPGKILPDIFAPLLEAAGDTSDPQLSEMFGRLLAAHLDPKTQNCVHPSYAKVLAQLSPFDAQVLDSLDQYERRNEKGYLYHEKQMSYAQIYKAFEKHPNQEVLLSIENLTRLGLVTESGRGTVWITAFGCRFIATCTGRETRESVGSSPLEELMDLLERHDNSLERLSMAWKEATTPGLQ